MKDAPAKANERPVPTFVAHGGSRCSSPTRVEFDGMTPTPILSVRDLKVHYPVYGGILRRQIDVVRAVDGVSFHVAPGTTVGLVGETGSGKTTIGRAILGLTPVTEGTVEFEGRRISGLPERKFRPIRRHLQIIFQDPFGSLNPRMTIREIIGESIEIHFPQLKKSERDEEVARLLREVRLEPEHMNRYPHEFSGGQRQRIGIARALAVKPRFIVCDEPVSALDVSVQAGIVNLLQDLQESHGLTYLFIAHDLAVVEHISQKVLVMFKGKIVEEGSVEEVYQNPRHEYTRKLLAAVPAM